MDKSKQSNVPKHDKSGPHDIFDLAFKRMLTLSGRSVICLINGLFGTNHNLDSTITYNSTEFVDETLVKVLADNIITINGRDSYHMEAEMAPNKDIHIRFMEYGFRYALGTMKPISFRNIGTDVPEMRFPRQYLIYLGQGRNVPDVFPVRIIFEGESDHIHNIPVIRFQEVKMEVLLKQRMFILLPFRLIHIRTELDEKQSDEQRRALIDQYKNDIIDPINLAFKEGYLSWRDRLNLLAIARRLEKHLFVGHEDIRKGLSNMRFKTLDLDIDEYDEKYEILEEKYNSLEEQFTAQSVLLSEKDREILELKKQMEELQKQVEESKKE